MSTMGELSDYSQSTQKYGLRDGDVLRAVYEFSAASE